MRNKVTQILRMFGQALLGDRLAGLELRMDDLRAHSNQVEAKVDHLIAQADAQRRLHEAELQDLRSQVVYLNSQVQDISAQVHDTNSQVHEINTQTHDLNSKVQDLTSQTEDLKARTQDLAENDGALLQGAIHIVESLRKTP